MSLFQLSYKNITGLLLAALLFIPWQIYAEEAIIKEGEKLSLDKCIEIAVKAHPSIVGSQYEVKAKEAQLGQARAGYFPKLDSTVGFTRNFEVKNTNDPYFVALLNQYNQNTANISLNQTIYDFGRTPTNVNIKKLNTESSRLDLDNSVITVINNVKFAYYGLLKAKRSLDVNKETVDQFNKHLAQAKLFFEAGTKPKYDVTKAEVDLSSAQLDLIGADNDLKIAWVTLNNAMGINIDTEYTVEDNLSFERYDVTLEGAVQAAYINRPDLKSLIAQKESAEKAVKLAKKEYYPKLTGTAQYNFAGSQYPLGQGWLAGVGMSMNLFDGLSTTNKIAEAAANARIADTKIDALKLQIILDVKQAYLNLLKAKERVSTTELQIKQASENLELATLRYQAGLTDPLEVTDANLSYNKAKLTNISALYEYKTARANIEKAMGNR
jgi:outer membrane protein